MAELRIVACESSKEVAEALGYWEARGYELAFEVDDVTSARFYDEDAGPQRLFRQEYAKAVRIVVFAKKKKP